LFLNTRALVLRDFKTYEFYVIFCYLKEFAICLLQCCVKIEVRFVEDLDNQPIRHFCIRMVASTKLNSRKRASVSEHDGTSRPRSGCTF